MCSANIKKEMLCECLFKLNRTKRRLKMTQHMNVENITNLITNPENKTSLNRRKLGFFFWFLMI